MNLDDFRHINMALHDLGKPCVDYDGDLLVSSLDDFGWEREIDHNAEREQAATATLATISKEWQLKVDRQQSLAAAAIRELVDERVEAIDFSLSTAERRCRIEAIILKDGRAEVDDATAHRLNEFAAYFARPDEPPLVYNAVSGLYRLTIRQ